MAALFCTRTRCIGTGAELLLLLILGNGSHETFINEPRTCAGVAPVLCDQRGARCFNTATVPCCNSPPRGSEAAVRKRSISNLIGHHIVLSTSYKFHNKV